MHITITQNTINLSNIYFECYIELLGKTIMCIVKSFHGYKGRVIWSTGSAKTLNVASWNFSSFLWSATSWCLNSSSYS